MDGWVVNGGTIERGLFDLDLPDLDKHNTLITRLSEGRESGGPR